MALKTYWDNYAYISDGVVKGIAVFDPNGAYTMANMLAQQQYGPSAFAVNVNDYPVVVGDTYEAGHFHRDGKVVQPVDNVKDDMTQIKLALAELGNLMAGGK